jgi:hypothetical protein
MSFLYGWFWSTKAVDGDEAERASRAQREVFEEMKQVFQECGLAELAERKYDYDAVIDELNEVIARADAAYENITIKNGKCVFPSEAIRARIKRLSEEYLDVVVRHKAFVYDHELLKIAVAKKIMDYHDLEGFDFDWHYWQVFRRSLAEDLPNRTQALEIIKNDKQEVSSEESWDTDDDDETLP